MYLTRHDYIQNYRWAFNGKLLPTSFSLKMLLEMPVNLIPDFLTALPALENANLSYLPPIESDQEVWACGVTYSYSRDAREMETEIKNIYHKVYDAERPELFFKAQGWRTIGHKGSIRIRKDTSWNVPEPELVLVVNSFGQIVGYTVGNDVSSRDIERENPLYLPQAKNYDGSCAIGPGIILTKKEDLDDLPIQIEILRKEKKVFEGNTRTSQLKRSYEELVNFHTRELTFPFGSFLMTGTGIVPPDEFTLETGDLVRIRIESLTLENLVAEN